MHHIRTVALSDPSAILPPNEVVASLGSCRDAVRSRVTRSLEIKVSVGESQGRLATVSPVPDLLRAFLLHDAGGFGMLLRG